MYLFHAHLRLLRKHPFYLASSNKLVFRNKRCNLFKRDDSQHAGSYQTRRRNTIDKDSLLCAASQSFAKRHRRTVPGRSVYVKVTGQFRTDLLRCGTKSCCAKASRSRGQSLATNHD